MTHPSAPGAIAAGKANSADYAGDVDVTETWEDLKNSTDAVLVDVRTQAEWNFVGVPDLSEAGKEAVLIEWQMFPTMETNPDFVAAVAEAAPSKSAPIYFLCRSGARSKSAAIALTQAGYERCYNVSGGFEGPHDPERHRGTVDGWKARGLPWVQG